MPKFYDFTAEEVRIFKKLSTPQKVQDFLDSIPINFEEMGETYLSPREVLRQGIAHCAEGAVFAAVALWYNGQKPLLLDLKTSSDDVDHVVALFQKDGYWGAISKTNHAVLRYREPVYKNIRELVMSYFHEYFKDNGKKTLRSYSRPFDLSKYKDQSWMTTGEDLDKLMEDLDDSPHVQILNPAQIRNLRKADQIEIAAGKIVEWKGKKRLRV
jgi:hypothetical protein